jgi:transcriptional regulator with XRE-family HTH domain
MKVGDNIKEIREGEKNFKRSYVAGKLNITTRAYSNIENNVAGITVNRLEKIANIFECNPLYILNYKSCKKKFYDSFHSPLNSQSISATYDVAGEQDLKTIIKLHQELLASERERIALLERLLKNNNIDFN